jgi:hypothetical protein
MRTSRRVPFAILTVLAVVALVIGGIAITRVPKAADEAPQAVVPGGGQEPGSEVEQGGEAEPGQGEEGEEGEEHENEEAAEQAETIARKREALERAVSAGSQVGGQRPVGDAPAPGWAGEQPFEGSAPDDWEPAVAADPNAPYVYVLVTRYGVTKPCSGNCPTPYIALRVSSDGGATFGPARPLCACKGSGQFDPIVEVVPNTGAVYALYMNGFNVLFTKSTDHGATWSAPSKTYGNVSWNDKPILAVSNDGNDVYVAFNGPTGGDPWIAQSHNGGGTWTQTKIVDSNRYYFAFDGDVAPDGTVYFSQSSILYGGGGNKGTLPTEPIEEHIFVSTDAGQTWTDRVAASVQPGVACPSGGCTPDYFLGHNAIAADASGAVTLLYDGAATSGGPQTIDARRSTNRGQTWSQPVTLSTVSEEAIAPAVESTGSGDVRAWYQQTAGGGNLDQWNTWYRRSTDGGATWATPVKISDATGGASYKATAGYLEPYGDYGELAITSAGKSFAVWGEGTSWDGPGGVWYNRQP